MVRVETGFCDVHHGLPVTRSGHWPAHILVRFLHRRLVVPRAQQPPGREHARLPVAPGPQAGRPPSLDEFLPVLGSDSARDVARVGVLLSRLVDVVARDLFADIHNSQLKGSIAHFAGIVLVVPHVTLILVVDPEDLVLPVLSVEGVEIVEKVHTPAVISLGTRRFGHQQQRP